MDHRGWASIRCADGAHDNTIVNSLIMLRYRPIAPKPTSSVGSLLPGSPPILQNGTVSARRTKRKYVRVRRNSRTRTRGFNSNKGRASSMASEELKNNNRSVVDTLQLLPENPTVQNPSSENHIPKGSLDRTAPTPITLVTVEFMNSSDDKCMDARGLGYTDLEKLTNLGVDTCPGFVSDGLNRVVWVNGAFRKMVRTKNEEEEMEVRLVMKERLIMSYWAFTCQAKVQYTWTKEKYSQMVVPCDAWRMDGGGFAWRLDVKAALSLGR